MKKLSKVQVLGIVRHVLTFTGGILVAKGLINDSTMVELVGGIVTVVGMIWSIVSKAPFSQHRTDTWITTRVVLTHYFTRTYVHTQDFNCLKVPLPPCIKECKLHPLLK
jgi:hypothetical protein